MNDETLAAKYLDILKEIDQSYLDPAYPDSKIALGLSGLFLPSASPNYEQAKNKIMVIGRETRDWNVLKSEPFTNIEDYVRLSMSKHSVFLNKQLSNTKSARGRTFHNFMRRIAAKSGKDGLIYSNLFCFSWGASNPSSSPIFNKIGPMSRRILEAQIQTLSPDVIIFANGVSSAGFRRECFPVRGEKNVCLNPRNHKSAGIAESQLWEFDLYGKIKCFRIPHPSARSQKAEEARQYLISILPDA